MIDLLLSRRSAPIKSMSAPGPDAAQLDKILRAAARVPDHNKLAPWWFITFQGDARAAFGKTLSAAWLAEEPEATPARLEQEAARFLRAPTIIAVISRIREGKAPQWEQVLSAGAACYNVSLAAQSLGFAANWVTEWYAYSPAVRAALGLDERDNVAGFIYIGTPTEKPEDRERPDLAQIVNQWQEGLTPAKGDRYGREGMGLPKPGFKTL